MKPVPSIAVLSDGAAGNEVQALALAGALGSASPEVWRGQPRWPWSSLAPQWSPVLAPAQFDPPLPTAVWPDLAIGAGRVGAAALLALRQASGGRTRTVQILNPRIDPARFDLVIAPAHDRLNAANAISIEGSLHAIDDAWLARERLAHAQLKRLSSPRTVVLIGGHRRGVSIDRRSFVRLAEALENWRLREPGSLIVIGSRRTPMAWVRRLRRMFDSADVLWFSASDGDNPYRGALAWGDRFIVTADSINMQCEALATGRPVYSLCERVPTGKLGRFHRAQVEAGRLRPLRSAPTDWSYVPLRELRRITPLLRERLGL
jgi:mitochondrial fission protein ELM1